MKLAIALFIHMKQIQNVICEAYGKSTHCNYVKVALSKSFRTKSKLLLLNNLNNKSFDFVLNILFIVMKQILINPQNCTKDFRTFFLKQL